MVLGAGDTFRAAAAEQLDQWAQRSGAEIVRAQDEKARPGTVLYQVRRSGVRQLHTGVPRGAHGVWYGVALLCAEGGGRQNAVACYLYHHVERIWVARAAAVGVAIWFCGRQGHHLPGITGLPPCGQIPAAGDSCTSCVVL